MPPARLRPPEGAATEGSTPTRLGGYRPPTTSELGLLGVGNTTEEVIMSEVTTRELEALRTELSWAEVA